MVQNRIIRNDSYIKVKFLSDYVVTLSDVKVMVQWFICKKKSVVRIKHVIPQFTYDSKIDENESWAFAEAGGVAGAIQPPAACACDEAASAVLPPTFHANVASLCS